MGEQHVRRLEAETLGRLDQRLDGPAGVDEEGRAALAVGDEEGVRDELRMGGALDDHAGHPCTIGRRRAARAGATSRVRPSR